MKIAYILPSLKNTGPGIVIHTLIKHIINEVDSVTVYYFDDSATKLDFPCEVKQIRFKDRLCFENYDIVHSNQYRPDKYIYKWLKSINRERVKLVSTIHQDIFANLKFSYNIFVATYFTPKWKKYLSIMDQRVAISQQLVDSYRGAFSSIYKVYNGVNVDYNAQNTKPDIKEQIYNLKAKGLNLIGTYAAINRRKGIDQLLPILEKCDNLGCVIIGEGSEKEKLEKIVRESSFSDRVLFFPYLDRPYNYLEDFDIYIMPSRNEGFGLALVEAAMTHTPVVCSDIPVFKEIFNDSQVSFFTLEDSGSLEKAIMFALENGEMLTANAYLRAKTNFDGNIMASNYLDLYNKIHNDNSVSSAL